jgi:hypothetical protein
MISLPRDPSFKREDKFIEQFDLHPALPFGITRTVSFDGAWLIEALLREQQTSDSLT